MTDRRNGPKPATGNSDKTKNSLANLKPFKPGQSGNISGRPKRKPITEMYERILDDPKNLEAITRAVLKAINGGSMAMVLQLREMTDRVEGKVVQSLEAEVTMNLADVIAAARNRAAERAANNSRG